MCGIAGALTSRGELLSDRTMAAMCAAIRHRGPDHTAWVREDPVALGYARLSVLDLSPSGNQPMEDASGRYVAVYNGEVYGFQELRAELEGAGVRFRSGSDTEVVVNLIGREGVGAVSRLNGMFALAVWDRQERELWLLRDPLGIKPLYYRTLDDGGLLFASEIKGLLAAPVAAPELDRTGVVNYLAFGHAVGARTALEGVWKLPPAHRLHMKLGRPPVVERYWTYPLPGGASARPDAEWIEEAESVLEGAVRRQMAADVPVGCFLSGGVDSSILASLMTRHSARLKTFAVGFTGHREFDETPDARLVARHLGTEHYDLFLSHNDLHGVVDDLVECYDEPFSDAAALPTLLLARFARRQVKVVITGEGGDEMFSGYRRYGAERLWNLYHHIPRPLKNFAIQAASRFGRARRLNRILRTLALDDAAERYAHWLLVFSAPELRALLQPDWQPALGAHDAAAPYRECFARLPDDCAVIDRLLYTDAQTWLPETYLEKVDKATMAASLEGRVPFLDLEVVRFAARCPPRVKIRGRQSKWILRKLARTMMPPSLVDKPKRGFSVPTDAWLRTSLREYAREVLLSRQARERGLFRADALEAMLDRHVSGQWDHNAEIWTLLMLELWLCKTCAAREKVA